MVDPVMISKSGHSLLKPDAIEAMKKQLFPLAILVTPNIHGAQQLSGIQITSLADARRAAKVIHGLGSKHVLIKGGHLLAERATDLLYDGRFFNVFKGEFIDTPHAWNWVHLRLSDCSTTGPWQDDHGRRRGSQDLCDRSDPSQFGDRPRCRSHQSFLLSTGIMKRSLLSSQSEGLERRPTSRLVRPSLSCTPLTFLLTGFMWLSVSFLLGVALLLGLVNGTPLPHWLKPVHVHGALLGGFLQLIIGGFLFSRANGHTHASATSHSSLFWALNGATVGLS